MRTPFWLPSGYRLHVYPPGNRKGLEARAMQRVLKAVEGQPLSGSGTFPDKIGPAPRQHISFAGFTLGMGRQDLTRLVEWTREGVQETILWNERQRELKNLVRALPATGPNPLPSGVWAQVLCELSPKEGATFLSAFNLPLVEFLVSGLSTQERAPILLEYPWTTKRFDESEDKALAVRLMLDGLSAPGKNWDRWYDLLLNSTQVRRVLMHAAKVADPETLQEFQRDPPNISLSSGHAGAWADLYCAVLPRMTPKAAVELAQRMWQLVVPRNPDHASHPKLSNQVAQAIDNVAPNLGIADRVRLKGVAIWNETLRRAGEGCNFSSYRGVSFPDMEELLKSGRLRKALTLSFEFPEMTRIPKEAFDQPLRTGLLVRGSRGLSLDTAVEAAESENLDHLEQLEIRDCGLRELPAAIAKLPSLTTLKLGFNEGLSLDSLDRAARNKQLQALTHLELPGCGIEAIPDSILRLPRLKSLKLEDRADNNELPRLRAEAGIASTAAIDALKSDLGLRCGELSLSRTGLCLADLTGLIGAGQLQNVTSLSLDLPGMTHIPKQIFSLPTLRKLQIGNAPGLQLDTFVEAIESGLAGELNAIWFTECGLHEVPAAILSLPKLDCLLIQRNEGLSLHAFDQAAREGHLQALETLGLLDCDIASVPDSLLKLPRLKVLGLKETAVGLCGNDLHRLRDRAGIVSTAAIEALKSESQARRYQYLSLSKTGVSAAQLAEALREGHLQDLEVLELDLSGVTRIPAEIFDLPKLKTIRIFNTTGLSLDTLTEAIEAGKLDRVEEFVFDSCGLRELPASIARLPNLTRLSIVRDGGLSLDTVEQAARDGHLRALTSLHLHDCGVESVPDAILALPNLRRIELQPESNAMLRLTGGSLSRVHSFTPPNSAAPETSTSDRSS
jgi:Leucine-rich repeat (LRR) protein